MTLFERLAAREPRPAWAMTARYTDGEGPVFSIRSASLAYAILDAALAVTVAQAAHRTVVVEILDPRGALIRREEVAP